MPVDVSLFWRGAGTKYSPVCFTTAVWKGRLSVAAAVAKLTATRNGGTAHALATQALARQLGQEYHNIAKCKRQREASFFRNLSFLKIRIFWTICVAGNLILWLSAVLVSTEDGDSIILYLGNLVLPALFREKENFRCRWLGWDLGVGLSCR